MHESRVESEVDSRAITASSVKRSLSGRLLDRFARMRSDSRSCRPPAFSSPPAASMYALLSATSCAPMSNSFFFAPRKTAASRLGRGYRSAR